MKEYRENRGNEENGKERRGKEAELKDRKEGRGKIEKNKR